MTQNWIPYEYLVKDVKKLPGEEVEEPGEQHGLDVGDQLRLADQPVQTSTLLQPLQSFIHC